MKEKIEFYNLGYNRTPVFKLTTDSDLYKNKITISKEELNKAKSKVIDKDINSLNVKISEIINKINNDLSDCNIKSNLNDNLDVSKIDDILKLIDEKLNELNTEKNHKAKSFLIGKKDKKNRSKKITELIEMLIRYKTDFISIKNEYNKLTERKLKIDYDEELDELSDDDPLERTINFLMHENN